MKSLSLAVSGAFLWIAFLVPVQGTTIVSNATPGDDWSFLNCIGENLDGFNVSGDDLTGTQLNSVSWLAGDLSAASLNSTFLNFGVFTGSDFSGASLEGARLDFATLTDTNFTGVSFDGAFFSVTTVSGADFRGANFAGVATVSSTVFDPVNPPIYDPFTDFSGTGFNPVATGWLLVPEPSAPLMMVLGFTLSGLVRRRKSILC